LPTLARWLEEQRLNQSTEKKIYLSYFGSGVPSYYGIEAERLPGHLDLDVREPKLSELRAGVYCISATMLQMVHLRPMGRWTAAYENAYQALVSLGQLYQFRHAPLAGLSEDLRDRLKWFEELRFARLCAFLRKRKPDHYIGYSILVYTLTDDDLNRALVLPPAEIVEDPLNAEPQ
jgi:hypothetical protein